MQPRFDESALDPVIRNYIHDLRSSIVDLQGKSVTDNERCKALESQLDDSREEIRELQSEIERLETIHSDEIRAMQHDLDAAVWAANASLQAKDEEIKSATRQLHGIQQTSDQNVFAVQQEVLQQKQTAHNLQRELTNIRLQHEQEQQERRELTQVRLDVASETEKFKSQMERERKEFTDERVRLDKEREALVHLRHELAREQQQQARERSTLAKQTSELEHLRAGDQKKMSEQWDQLVKEQENIDRQWSELRRQQREASVAVQQAKVDQAKLASQRAEMQTEIRKQVQHESKKVEEAMTLLAKSKNEYEILSAEAHKTMLNAEAERNNWANAAALSQSKMGPFVGNPAASVHRASGKLSKSHTLEPSMLRNVTTAEEIEWKKRMQLEKASASFNDVVDNTERDIWTPSKATLPALRRKFSDISLMSEIPFPPAAATGGGTSQWPLSVNESWEKDTHKTAYSAPALTVFNSALQSGTGGGAVGMRPPLPLTTNYLSHSSIIPNDTEELPPSGPAPHNVAQLSLLNVSFGLLKHTKQVFQTLALGDKYLTLLTFTKWAEGNLTPEQLNSVIGLVDVRHEGRVSFWEFFAIQVYMILQLNGHSPKIEFRDFLNFCAGNHHPNAVWQSIPQYTPSFDTTNPSNNKYFSSHRKLISQQTQPLYQQTTPSSTSLNPVGGLPAVPVNPPQYNQ